MSYLKEIWASSSGRRVVDNYISLLFIHGTNIILPLITLPYLVRVLGIEKYGLILFAQSFCTILYIFVEFGFNLSATRRISINRSDTKAVSEIFSAVLCLKMIFMAVIFILFTLLVVTLSRFRAESGVYLLSFGVILGQALFPDWFFQGMEKMRVIAVVNVIAKIIFTALIFVFIQNVQDYEKVPLFQSVGFIAAGILSLILSLRLTTLQKPSLGLMKELVVESSSLFVANFSARLFNSANVFILGFFAGDALAGIYGSIEKIIIALKSFFSPLYQAVFPWLSKQDKTSQRAQLKKLAPYIVLTSSIFVTVVLLFGQWILDFLFDNPEITGYLLAFKALSIIILFSSLNMLLMSLYFPATGQYKLRMKILIVAGLFNIILATLCVYFFGLYGLVFAVICTELLLLFLASYHYNKNTVVST